MRRFNPNTNYQPDRLQRVAMGLMVILTLVTFVGTNMQALLWQSSDWLVSTVLPAVVVDLTNDERSDLAAAPLQRNAKLDEAARLKAKHMAENEYFAHFAPDGTTPWSFFNESGYVYAHAGENLAIHFTDSTEVVEAWMQSPAHRKNIVDQKYTEIGVGTAKGTFDGYDTVYVVQLFGTPAIAPITPAKAEPAPEPAFAPIVPTAVEEAELAALQVQIESVAGAIDELSVVPEVEIIATESDPDQVLVTKTKPDIPVVEPLEVEPVTIPTEPATKVAMSEAATVVVSTELATSSGLAVATLIEPSRAHAGATLAAAATQPNLILDIVYTGIVGLIIVLLVLAMIGEAKRFHVVQVAYSLALLLTIGGLWYVHTLLTSGAVIA